jgi:hypothetical protein
VLLSADRAFVFDGDFVELEPAIAGTRDATLAQSSHFVFVHRHKAACDAKVLSQDPIRIDSADRRSHVETHSVPQRFSSFDCARSDHITPAAKALHSYSRNTPPHELRQHVLFEASEACVEAGRCRRENHKPASSNEWPDLCGP